MKKIIFNEDQIKEIKRLYREENITKLEISKIYNVNRHKIEDILLKTKRNFEDENWLIENINNGLQIKEIAKIAKCNPDTISKYLKKYNISINNKTLTSRKYNFDFEYFKDINREDKAYWLGFIVADGHIDYSSSYNRLQILLSKNDISHLEKFKNDIESEHLIKECETKLKSNNKTYKQCFIKIYSKEIVEDLIKLGLKPNKSCKEVFPKIDDKYIRHFIRGYFDGDGCFSYWLEKTDKYSCQVTIVGGHDFLNAMREYIKSKVNIDMHLSNDSNELYRLTISCSKALKLLNWLYKNSNTRLDRKFIKYKEYLSIPRNKRYSLNSSES